MDGNPHVVEAAALAVLSDIYSWDGEDVAVLHGLSKEFAAAKRLDGIEFDVDWTRVQSAVPVPPTLAGDYGVRFIDPCGGILVGGSPSGSIPFEAATLDEILSLVRVGTPDPWDAFDEDDGEDPCGSAGAREPEGPEGRKGPEVREGIWTSKGGFGFEEEGASA